MSGALLAAFVKGAFSFLFIYSFVNEKKPLAKPCEHCMKRLVSRLCLPVHANVCQGHSNDHQALL